MLFTVLIGFLTVVGFKPTKFDALTLGGSLAWKDQVKEILASERKSKPAVLSSQPSLFLGAETTDTGSLDDEGPPLGQFNAFLGEQAPFVTKGSLADELGIKSYKVEPGDTPAAAAKKFKLKLETILSANDLRYGDYILPGEVLLILPVDGLLHKVQPGQTLDSIAENYKVGIEVIAKANLIPADGSSLETGQDLLVPGAKTFIASVPPSTGTALADYDGYYAFPTTGRNWGRPHSNNGVDISNQCGTEIYAAASGRVAETAVTQSTYRFANNGYGSYIKVAHQNGTQTLYGHLLSVLVNEGDVVSKGQAIAWMGGRPGTPGAGNSTGCHLHFEVRGAKNPFIRYR